MLRLFSTHDVSQILAVTTARISQLVAEGKLRPFARVGEGRGTLIFSEHQVAKVIAEREAEGERRSAAATEASKRMEKAAPIQVDAA